MLEVSSNKIITIPRGDYGELEVELNLGNNMCPELYELNQGDKVFFSVMEPNDYFEDGVIRKIYSQDTVPVEPKTSVSFSFNSDDTSCLNCGVYYYSIKLKKADGTLYTILTNKKFIILE